MDYDHNRPCLVIWEATQASAQAVPHPLELDTTEAYAMIAQVARLQPESFLLTGSDPMARTDLVGLIASATRRGLRVTMSSNATKHAASADFRAKRDAGLQQISFGLDRCGTGSDGDYLLAAARSARAARLPVRLHTTFTRQNLGEFDALAARVNEIQPKRWSVFKSGSVADNGTASLTQAESEELTHKLTRLAEQVAYDIKTAESVVPRDQCTASGSMKGRGFLFITHVGGIRPSNFHPITAGNVRVCDLVDVYHRCETLQQIRATTAASNGHPAHDLPTGGIPNCGAGAPMDLAPA